MGRVTFKGFDDFSRRAPGIFSRDVKLMGGELGTIVLREMVTQSVIRTPVGPEEDAARRRVEGAAYGHMRDTWRTLISGQGEVSGIPTMKAGDRAARINFAAHAGIIDNGRRRSKAYRRKKKSGGKGTPHTRMIGSLKAPRGISRPTGEHLEARKNRHIKAAIRLAETKGGR